MGQGILTEPFRMGITALEPGRDSLMNAKELEAFHKFEVWDLETGAGIYRCVE